MRCLYCDSFITDYPANGLCPNCCGKLPPPPPPVQPIVQPVYVQPVYQPVYQPVRPVAAVPGVNCCPKCKGLQLTYEKRGFSWILGIFGFFMIPVFGLLLGFCGRNKQKYLRCNTCRHKWIRR